MKPLKIWAISRWLFASVLLIWTYLAVNHTLFSIWATVAPPSNKYPEAWAFEAYTWMGYSVARLCLAIAVAINLRQGFPYWRSKWNFVLVAIALTGLIWPRAQHMLEIDRCLDAGGRWHETYQRCEV